VPRRRTLATAIHGLRSLHAGCVSPSWLRLPARPAAGARGCPCPVAGRSLRPSMACAHSMRAAFRHPGCACPQGRWPRRGVARAPSPDVRYGHPWPALTPCGLRFAILAALARKAGGRGEGLPVPRRRTFATAIHGLRSLHAGCASPSWLRLPARPAAGARATPRGYRIGGTFARHRIACESMHDPSARAISTAAGMESTDRRCGRNHGLTASMRW